MNVKISRQKGIVLIIALVILTSMTVVGVSSISSGVMQTKMASNQNTVSLAFDAAEVAVEGIVHEGSSANLRAGNVMGGAGVPEVDVLTAARNAGAITNNNQVNMAQLPTCDQIANALWSQRRVNAAGLQDNAVHNGGGAMMDVPEINAWSKSAFVGLKNITDPTSGLVSSIVDTDGARNRTVFEVFMLKGCGHVNGTVINAANTVVVSRQSVELGEN